ncbi:MAG: ATP-binding cassette domain-containing protein [Spirochaetaceae bacterium]|jgi:ABC-type multidrug transport system ATPase subunit|nr:ATP-binding cassette domain-containing protein [Spirochaetaceae bacterium]
MMANAVIELKKVSFHAQNAVIVEDFSAQFAEGRSTALVGPSGGGKSTVLKLAAGLLVPARGEVLYRDRNIAAMNRAQNLVFRREAAMVFQDSALWANRNLSETLDLPLRIHYPEMRTEERRRRIREVTLQAGYRKNLDIRPALLSMGEQKLIAFARAMLCRPSLLFLDEWTESLDDDAARRLITLVRQFRAAGNTIIFISHDLEVVTNLADYVIMVAGGKKVMELEGSEISGNALVQMMVEDGTA